MKKNIEIKRIIPNVNVGLNDEQIKERINGGFINKSKSNNEKSYLRIVFDNFFNSFNVVLISICLVFLFFVIYLNASGHKEVADTYFGYSKFTFIIPVFINSIIGSVQEIHSKIVLHKINIVNKAKAKVIRNGQEEIIYSDEILLDDIIILNAGDQVLCDISILEGNIEIDESLLTGEADLIKKGKDDKLLSGSTVIVGSCKGVVTSVGEDTYASKLSSKVKSIAKNKSELMVSIFTLIKFLALVLIGIVIVVISTLVYKVARWGSDPSVWSEDLSITYSLSSASTWARIVLTAGAFAIGVIPTGLVLLTSLTLALSIIKLAKENTLIQDLYSLENLSRVDTICLDKTGTLTDGTMEVTKEIIFINKEEVLSYIQEFNFASTDNNSTALAIKNKYGTKEIKNYSYEPFSSKDKCSSLIYVDKTKLTLGAPDYLISTSSKEYEIVKKESSLGSRVIALKKDDTLIALFILKDNIRKSAKDTITYFYENNLDIKIISGDNPLTVSYIASLCGVKDTDKYISLDNVKDEEIPSLVSSYTIFARVSPEQKKLIIEALQANNKKVGMTGDGVNDILALRKANASITFKKATDAAKACSDVVLMDDDFVHLKEVISQGRRVVNNIQRSATLFLMKTTCFVLLSLLLIPFKKGQMFFSVENIYLMQFSVIALAGFFLSLESSKEPIKGTFKDNVLIKALVSGTFMTFSALLPILINQISLLTTGKVTFNNSNVSTMISLLTTISGLIVLITMTYPHNKYRKGVLIITFLSVIVVGLFSPTSFIGGKATTFSMIRSDDGNIFHSQFFKEMFQPWNCPSLISLNEQALQTYLTLGLFILIGLPLYIFLLNLITKKKRK